MVLEHEYMHQETLLYMMQQLPIREKRPASDPVRYSFQLGAALPGDQDPRGARRAWARISMRSTFGWDNEFEQIVVDVAGVHASTLCRSPTVNSSSSSKPEAMTSRALLAAAKIGAGRTWKRNIIRRCWRRTSGRVVLSRDVRRTFRSGKLQAGRFTSAWRRRAPMRAGAASACQPKPNFTAPLITGQTSARRLILGATTQPDQQSRQFRFRLLVAGARRFASRRSEPLGSS